MKKNDTERILTPSVVRDQVSFQLQGAFRRVRDELGIGSDEELARQLGWPTTYVHWLSRQREFPMDRACELAAAGGCHLDELLRIANLRSDQ